MVVARGGVEGGKKGRGFFGVGTEKEIFLGEKADTEKVRSYRLSSSHTLLLPIIFLWFFSYPAEEGEKMSAMPIYTQRR